MTLRPKKYIYFLKIIKNVLLLGNFPLSLQPEIFSINI